MNKSIRNTGRTAVPLLLGILLLSGCATYQHPDFNARHAKIHSIAIIPSSVEVYRLSFKGDKDPMHDASAEANQVAGDEIASLMKQKGYAVRPMDLSEEALTGKPELRTAWHTTNELFLKILGDIQKGRKGKTPYTLGVDVNILADHAQADSLVFMTGEGIKKTGGEITQEVILSALFGTPIRPSETLAQLAVVDSNTGEILWVNRNSNVAINPADPAQVRSMVRDILQIFPKSAAEQSREKSKKKERQEQVAQPTHNFGARAPLTPPVTP